MLGGCFDSCAQIFNNTIVWSLASYFTSKTMLRINREVVKCANLLTANGLKLNCVRALATTTLTNPAHLHHKTGSALKTAKYPRPLRTRKSGKDILLDPLWNKSLAFSYSERDRLGIRGLVPPVVRTLDEQVARAMHHMRNQPDDVAKNLYLQDIHNRNETMYHRILVDYVSFIHN